MTNLPKNRNRSWFFYNVLCAMVTILGNSLFIYQTIVMSGVILISVSSIAWAVLEVIEYNDKQNTKDKIFWV